MSGHTPGPWKWWTSCSFRRLSSEATGRDGDVLHATVQSDGHPDVHLPNGGWDGPDGRLIAAAPELLEFAQLYVDAWAAGEVSDKRLLRVAGNLIDKATGEQP